MQPSLYFRLANKASAGTVKIKIPTRLLAELGNKFKAIELCEFVKNWPLPLCANISETVLVPLINAQ